MTDALAGFVYLRSASGHYARYGKLELAW